MNTTELCDTVIRELGNIRCVSCGEPLDEKMVEDGKGADMFVAEMRFQPGSHNYPYGPDDPHVIFFLCHECSPCVEELKKCIKDRDEYERSLDRVGTALLDLASRIDPKGVRRAIDKMAEHISRGD